MHNHLVFTQERNCRPDKGRGRRIGSRFSGKRRPEGTVAEKRVSGLAESRRGHLTLTEKHKEIATESRREVAAQRGPRRSPKTIRPTYIGKKASARGGELGGRERGTNYAGGGGGGSQGKELEKSL